MTMGAGPPRLLDALSWAAEAAEEIGVHTARDVHRAVAGTVESLQPDSAVPRLVMGAHQAIAAGVYGGVGLGFAAASRGLAAAAAAGFGPPLESGRGGRLVRSALNAMTGDRLAVERPRLAIPMTVRVGGADVAVARGALATAYPEAGDRVAVLLHGLGEDDGSWAFGRDRVGGSYPETLAELGWTAVRIRYNTGLSLRENGAGLSALLRHLVAEWPVPPARLALIGHSMGGLVARAACAVRLDDATWTGLVSDLVTLGTPHEGAPAAVLVGRGSRTLSRLPHTAPWGRILDRRSAGIEDLRSGLGEEVPGLAQVRHRLVSATVREEHHPVSTVAGDLLVRTGSARARGVPLPDPEILHVSRAHHFDLLNHPEVHDALRRWLR